MSYFFIIVITIFSLYEKNPIYLFALVFSFVHELSHVVATMLVKCSVKELKFMPFGIKMQLKNNMELLKIKSKLIILSAGCVANFVTALLIFLIKAELAELILLNLAIGIFNILPIGTLDGGRILSAVLEEVLPLKKALLISDIISFSCVSVLLVLGFYTLFESGYNISLIITSAYLLTLLIMRQKS